MSEGRRILLVDDDRDWALDYSVLLEGVAEVTLAHDAKSATEALSRTSFDAVLLDLRFHGEDLGLVILEQALAVDSALPVILLTSHDSARLAVSALRRGAFDYLLKGSPFEEVQAVLHRAFEHREVRAELGRMRARLDDLEGCEWVGSSPESERILAEVHRVAPRDTVVLIRGETGTGKGVLSRMIHRLSGRKGPEMIFHGSSGRRSSEELVESELFGAVRGAFTGADRDRDGLVRTAAQGTLVLDDVEEVPLGTQSKLLQLLEERTYRPLGGTRALPCEARIIVTTKPCLEARVEEGLFRRDLYYRIRVYPIELPSLRERPEDIPALAAYFLDRFRRENKVEIEGFSPEACSWMVSYPWPGNVRELKNAVEAAVLCCRGRVLGVRDFPGRIPKGARIGSHGLSKAAMQKEYVDRLMREAGGNVSRAARLAGMTRSGFQRLRKRIGSGEAEAD